MDVSAAQPQWYRLEDDGQVPNNPACPLVIYPAVLRLDSSDPASTWEQLFATNGWGDSWRNGVFPYHHYHSTAHEVLGVYQGWADVQMGGASGPRLRISAGDAVIVPAGVAHCGHETGDGFACVGAYPRGQHPDLCRPGADRTSNRAQIESVALPDRDPVYGVNGFLFKYWGGGC